MTKVTLEKTEIMYIKKVLGKQKPEPKNQTIFNNLKTKLEVKEPTGKWCGCCYESELKDFYN